MDWYTIIRHYQIKNLPNHRKETEWFANLTTLANSIEKATMAENCYGKRYRHQCRIPHRVLQTSFQKLKADEESVRACISFEELHTLIKLTLKSISGIGELYCYDTALRIGARLGLTPRTVYLHAGTREGASFITDIRGKDFLGRECLPSELRQLPPEQIEDILCIYKDEIKEMHNKTIHRTRRNRTPCR